MKTIFIADLHLHMQDPITYTNFLRFLRSKALCADELYILGDLFDLWIGDDTLKYHQYMEVVKVIKELMYFGIKCFFIHGNHDFLIGTRFACESGMTILPDKQVLSLYGRKILIMHGDILCTNDIKYQILRTTIRTPWIQAIFLTLPMFIRQSIAEMIRASSTMSNDNKQSSIMDVNQKTVVDVMEKYCVQWLIHGHTHLPNVHKFIVNNKPAFRLVLGAWCSYSCSMVIVTPESIKLIHSSF